MSSESRGVQVEARTLSGVHIGQRVSCARPNGSVLAGHLVSLEHDAESVLLVVDDYGDRLGWSVAPTDLVTLTDGGEDE